MIEEYTQEEKNAASILLTMEQNNTTEYVQVSKLEIDAIMQKLNGLDAIMQKLTGLEQEVKFLRQQQHQKRSFSASSSSSEPCDNIVEFKIYKKSVLVTGNTKPHKEFLKKYKASWNPTLKGWILNRERGRRCAKKFKKKHVDIAEVQGQVLVDSDSEYSSESN